MKSLKILIVFIILVLSVGNILQAQEIQSEIVIDNDCFTMEIDKGYLDIKIYFNMTVTNYQNHDLTIRDDMGIYSLTCSGNETCSFRWFYDKPTGCLNMDFEIQCIPTRPAAINGCKADGCVVIVDARETCDPNPN